MSEAENEDTQLRSVAMQTSHSILSARQDAERELLTAKDKLERSAKELAQALAMTKVTLEATTDGIVVTDGEGRITGHNQNFLDIWPIEETLLFDPTYAGLIEAMNRLLKDPVQFHQRIREILENPPATTYDLLEMIDGRLLERFSHRHSVDGVEQGRVWSFRDVTEQRRIDTELHQQKEWFRVTLSSIGDAVITTDTAGNVTFLNAIAENLTGWTTADALGLPLVQVFNIINETSRLPVENPVEKVLLEGNIVGLANHTVLIARNGIETAIEDSAAPIRDEKGAILGVVMVFHDVTERRQSEEAQRESQERLGAALRAANTGTFRWIIGTDELQADANLVGLIDPDFRKPLTILGDFIACADPADRELLENAFRNCGRNGGNFQIQFRIRQPGGEVRWLDANGRTYADELGRQIYLTGACTEITERKLAEEARLILAAIVECSDDAIISKSLNGIVQSWNEGAERLFGYKAEEMVGQPVSTLIPPDRQDEEPQILSRLQKGERIDHYETVRRRRDGTLFDVSLSVSPLRNNRGEIIGASKIARDITGRKLAEKALQESQGRMALAMEAGQMGDWEWIIGEGRVIWSPTLEIIHGLEPHSFGGSFEEFQRDMHPEDRERVLAHITTSLEQRSNYRVEYRIIKPDGKLAWIEARGRIFLDESGEPIRMAGVCMDITSRKEAEADLKASEARFRQLADSMPQIVWTARPDGTLNYYNQRWYDFSGFTEETDNAEQWQRVVHPDDLGSCLAVWADCVATGRPYQFDFRLLNKEGQYRWHLVRALPVRNPAGEIISWYGSCTDMHEQRLTVDALHQARAVSEQANRMKDDFLAALSHELWTPLTPVLAILYNLRQNGDLPESIRQDLDSVRRNVELEARLIDDLLDLTRITRGKMELRREQVVLAKVIEDAINTCEPELLAKGLRLIQEAGDREIEVFADQARVTQIIWNLLKNAIKFTPPGGEITVQVREDSENVEIEVADTGIGIEPERLDKVFDAFEQGGRNITRQFGGLGLGLAISKALAEAHGGTLAAASPGAGRGSTFTLRLPAVKTRLPRHEPAAPVPAAASDIIEPPDAEPARVTTLLLVEDHADTAIVFSRILRGLGFKVRHAETISAALQIAEVEMAEGGVDLVISDLGLPDGSGNDLMRELSLRYHLRGIALSGYGMDTDLEESTAAGFSRHLTKPVDIEVLRAAIKDVLGQ